MSNILKNWKTTLAGVAMVVLAGLQATHKITTDQFATFTSLLTALGLGLAKDAGNTQA